MKLKYLLVLGLILTIGQATYGQTSNGTSNHGEIGVSFSSISNNDVVYFEDVAGSSSFDGQDFFSLGISYIHPFNNWLEIEAAVEYSKFTIEVNPPYYPGLDNNSYNTEVSLLNIPVSLRANFLSYFYVNSGLLFDIDISDSNSIANQSGIGGMVGVGAKYDFDFGASIFVNPYVKTHSIIPFSKEGSIHQRVTESAIRFGVTYHL